MDSDLDFALLDDVLPIAPPSAPVIGAEIRAARPTALGPLLEYAYQARGNPRELPPVSDLAATASVRELSRVLAIGRFNRMRASLSHQAAPAEFHWVPPTPQDFSAQAWIMFLRRVQNAAERAGFSSRVARGLTGAFGEMADNAFRHSLAVPTALAGYRWVVGTFEFVVVDGGQGVLASLRTSPDYQHLHDFGDALTVALREGESRFGRWGGRGTGFQTVFLSLADLSGFLRFRSGDHALTVDGTSPDLSRARLNQVGLPFDGFLVAVTCHPR